MVLKEKDGSRVCRLCDRPWVIHTLQERKDCWELISMLKTFPGITITTTEPEDTSDRTDRTGE